MAKKKQDLDGKQLVCQGKENDRSNGVVLLLEHSDPSRRNVSHIEIAKDMILRVPQDISEPDARHLLEVDDWKFRVEDQPQASDESKGDK